ncbi:MAG: hypothetical protein QM820_37360 [Minicystis sp.]
MSQQFTPVFVAGQLFWQSESEEHCDTHIAPPEVLEDVDDEEDDDELDELLLTVVVVLDVLGEPPAPPLPPAASVSLPDAQAANTAGVKRARAR